MTTKPQTTTALGTRTASHAAAEKLAATTTAHGATEQRYRQLSDREHARERAAMYLGGGMQPVVMREYVVNDAMDAVALQRLVVSPGALKVVDEVIVNACDSYTHARSNIWITVAADRTITVRNDRAAIEIARTHALDGREMWIPQFIFGEFRTSSTYNDNAERLTGGVNGLGSKLTNAHSAWFEVRTQDGTQRYTQRWHACMARVDPPEITASADPERWVEVAFQLDWPTFCTSEAHWPDFVAAVRMRAVHCAMFCTSAVYWQGTRITLPWARFNELYIAHPVVQCVIGRAPREWRVVIAAKQNDEPREQFSVVNGIRVSTGTHIDTLVRQILAWVEPRWLELKDPRAARAAGAATRRLEAAGSARAAATTAAERTAARAAAAEARRAAAAVPKFDRRTVERYIWVGVLAYINKPEFSSQSKDQLKSADAAFADYVIPESAMQAFWMQLRPLLEFEIFRAAASEDTRARGGTRNIKGYKPAMWAGTARRHETQLFVAEGDSAMGTVDKGISNANTALNYNTCGVYSIQGVPMNTRTHVERRRNPVSGDEVVMRNEALRNNERYAGLHRILALDPRCTYRTPAERRQLTYGRIIIMTDADPDGAGCIRGLILDHFMVLWPALVAHGFVHFMVTPVIRAYPRRGRECVEEFYSDAEYQLWQRTHAADIARWEVVHFKGLAGHGAEEIEHMFKRWENNVVRYVVDARSEAACEVYFGADADLRKAVLTRVPRHTERDWFERDATGLWVSVTRYMNTEVRAQQIYNISRHIRHAVDGGVVSWRKVWAGSRAMFASSNERAKVSALGGYIIQHMNYHHGETSLQNTITGESQSYPGAREFPMLLALSNSGSRKAGGKDAGAPRYIYTKLNSHLSAALMPPVDDWLLDYTWDDGQRGEPVNYVPTAPLAILENYSSPGHGWSCVTWARDYWTVTAETRRRLEALRADAAASVGRLAPAAATSTARTRVRTDAAADFVFSKHRWHHVITVEHGVEVSTAVFRRAGDRLHITELPVRTWNEFWLHGNPKNKGAHGAGEVPGVVDVEDASTDTDINVTMHCEPGWLAARSDADLVRQLDLRIALHPQLNFLVDGAVREFASYREVYEVWWAARRELYDRRVAREHLLVELRIEMCGNELRYVDERETLELSGLESEAQSARLAHAGFVRFHHTLLNRPQFEALATLRDAVTGTAASYQYLLIMNSNDLSKRGRTVISERMARLRSELARLTRPNASVLIQIEELDTLDAVVLKGQTGGWLSWETRARWA